MESKNAAKKQKASYKQIKLLGQGSFGKAYLVENTLDKVHFINLVYRSYKINDSRKNDRKGTKGSILGSQNSRKIETSKHYKIH